MYRPRSANSMNPIKPADHWPRVITGMLGLCVGLGWSLQGSAQESNVLTALASRNVKSCSIHLALPAQWTLKVERSDRHCKIVAQKPAGDSLCGVYDEGDSEGNGKKTFCDEEKIIVIDVQPGSIDKLAKVTGIEDPSTTPEHASDPRWGDFMFANGTWGMDATMSNYRGANEDGFPGTMISSPVETHEIQGAAHRTVYAQRPWRKHFQEGTYCCTAATWEALIDLPGARFAWIEIQWYEDEKNVVRFLQSLK